MSEEEVITSLAKYNTKDLLGKGGYGHVFKGELKATGETAAVKVVEKEGKYLREIDILKSFQGLNHDNLVRLLDFEELDKTLLIITEFCSLGHLSNYIRCYKPLREEVLRNFLKQIGEGYRVLKMNNVIHRDLKPQNILLSPSEFNQELLNGYPHHTGIVIKIADFGISRFLDENGRASTDIGSPMYRAPEISKRNYDYRVDFFSLGVIIVECLIGWKELAKFENKKTEFRTFSRSIGKHASKDLRDLLSQLLKRIPSNRIKFDGFMAHKFLNPGKPTIFAVSNVAAPPPSAHRNTIPAFQTPVLSDTQQGNCSTQEMRTQSDENTPHNNVNALDPASEDQIRGRLLHNGASSYSRGKDATEDWKRFLWLFAFRRGKVSGRRRTPRPWQGQRLLSAAGPRPAVTPGQYQRRRLVRAARRCQGGRRGSAAGSAISNVAAPPPLEHRNTIPAFQTPVLSDTQQVSSRTQEMPTE